MKKFLFFLFVAALTGTIQSQVCVIDLSTQTAVDQFIIDNPTCTIIDGDVSLGYGNVDPLQNVDGLQNITEITGMLSVFGSNGSDLQGLSNLTAVNFLDVRGELTSNQLSALSNIQNVSSVYIGANFIEDLHAFDSITSLDELMIDFQPGIVQLPPPSFYDVFPNLTTVSNGLSIGSNYDSANGDAVCDTLTGFNALTSVGSLSIGPDDNYVFNTTSFDGFHNIQTITNTFFIGLWYLTDVVGFENLQSVEDIQVWSWTCDCNLPDFESLTSLTTSMLFCYAWSSPDFPNLTSVNGDFSLNGYVDEVGCSALENVEGNFYFSISSSTGLTPTMQLQSLDSVGGDFSVQYSNLDNLNFLSGLDYVGGIFQISQNPNLATCDIWYLCENLPIDPTSIIIFGNSPGCNSVDEVLASCGDTYAEGEVFYDLDCNGVFDNADFYENNPVIVNEQNIPVSSSDYFGHYFVPLQDNSTTTLSVIGLPGFSMVPQTITTTATTTTYNNVHFGLCPQADLHNVSVSQYLSAPFSPGFGRYQYFEITNLGPQIEEVALTYELTNIPGATVSVITDEGVLSGNTIQWSTLSVPAFGYKTVAVFFQVSATTPIGQVFNSNVSATIVPGTLTDIFPSNNFLTFINIVVGSYDPNDITVNIPAYNHDLIAPQTALSLDYTIRFQNTGTAEAINVRVLDDIEEDLDISSFEMIGSSHPCTLTFNENNQVEWLFENIMLPDSTSEEEASHGYIQYRIKTQPNLMLEDVVENTAAIYFDFNEPIITNTATTVFYVCPATPEPMTDQSICEGDVLVLSGPLGWEDYVWSTFEGEISTTNQLQIMSLHAGTFDIAFDASTEYCQYHDDINVTVISTPAAPVISQIGNTLTATGSGVFIWTFNGDILSESGNSIEIQESGIYSVEVVVNSCSSTITSGNFTAIGVEESKAPNFILSPNPMFNQAQMKIQNGLGQEIYLTISDPMGKIIRSQKITSDMVRIDRNDMASGVYYVSMFNPQGVIFMTQKLLVE